VICAIFGSVCAALCVWELISAARVAGRIEELQRQLDELASIGGAS